MNRQRGFAIGMLMYGVVALALVSAIGYGVHRYNEGVRAEAIADTKADMQEEFSAALKAKLGCASVEQCTLMVDGMAEQIAEHGRRTAARTKAAAEAEAASKAALAKLAGDYQSLMAQQPTVRGDACASACSLLRSQPLL
jgi:hypothetical protein